MKVPVDECLAGPAMDVAVAEALGWEQIGEGAALNWRMPTGELRTREETSFGSFKPSEDIAAAWELAELCKHGCFFVGWSEEWVVSYCVIGSVKAYGESPALAICRAFLRANGVEYVEVKDE